MVLVKGFLASGAGTVLEVLYGVLLYKSNDSDKPSL